MAGVRKTGGWGAARRGTEGGGARLNRAIDKALKAEAQGLRKEIVLQVRDQGKDAPFKPLSPWTLAKRRLLNRGGTKALIQRGDLLGSIAVIARGDEIFIGVPRSARGKDGQDLVRVAAVHEYGTDPIIIPVNARMRRLLGMLLRKMTGKERATLPATRGSGGAVVVQIPARPYLRPAFERWKVGAQKRLQRRIAENMGWKNR